MKVFKKLFNRAKKSDGSYELSSFWTSANTVEFDNGDTLEKCKADMEDALAHKGDGLYYDEQTKYLYLLSGDTRLSGVEITTGGTGEVLGDVSDVSLTPTETSMTIKWTDPQDGETVEWAGTTVIRKRGSRPVDMLDGDVVVDSTTRNQYRTSGYVDTNLAKNTLYYYRFFPYSTEGKIRTGLAVSMKTLADETIIEEFPTVSGVYTYSGVEQTVVLNDYDPEKMVIQSGNTGTNAGDYTAIVAPKYGMHWPDNSTDPIELNWTIHKASITIVPSQSGTVTYTGTARTPAWSDYDENKLALTGDTSGVDAGTYTATFTPTSNYQWGDGSTTGKNVDWVIQKASITTVPTQSGTLNYTGETLSPTWNNYDPAQLTISGQTSGTNAGQYIAVFTPTANYKWSDGTTGGRESMWEIVNRTISIVPSQSGSLTYSGSSQSPTWSNYDPEKMTVADDSATNAGSYTAVFTPKEGYSWSDGTTTGKNVTWTIGRATIVNYPSQSGTLNYTGSSQSPTWSYYDSSKMTMSGTTSGTNAGTYTATFTPTSNYQWTGGVTSARNVSWVINKINDTLTLSKLSMAFSTSGATDTSTASGYHGTLSVTTSNSSVATASISGSTITVTCAGSGTATITVTTSATTNYYAISKSIDVTASTTQKIQYVPSQGGTLTYNGSTKTPSWNNYSSTQLTMGGTTSGTNAGTYTATFTPKSGYAWSDGTTVTKSVDWTIEKGTLNFDVSPTSVTVDVNGDVDVNLSGYTYDPYDSTDGYWPRVIVTASQAGYIHAAIVNTSSTTGAKVRITGQAAGSVTVTIRTNDNNYNQVTKTVSVTVNSVLQDRWISKTWYGVQPAAGNIWSDGDNIYYSNSSNGIQKVLNGSNWTDKAWYGCDPYPAYIWIDGENVYYSKSDMHYVLNKSTSTWETKTWNGLTKFYGNSIWSDGNNVYISQGSTQYVLNKSTSTWEIKTWNGLSTFYKMNIWNDGETIYYSDRYGAQFVLNKSTSTWETKTWSGRGGSSIDGEYIWTDGRNIYYSYGNTHTVLDRSTSTWNDKIWSGLTNFIGSNVWTDGNSIYYSDGSNEYVLT